MLILGVERQREQASRSPFEGVFAAVMGLHRGRAVAFQHINHLFEKMLLRRRVTAGIEVKQEHRHEIPPPLEMDRGALCPHPGPGPGLDGEEIDAEVLHHRQVFRLQPIQIRVE